jgi:bifunctional UDP-N-acetylglucosamine pyrophosphorylase/glucosamine-1-phosphate N-acetyltransferase
LDELHGEVVVTYGDVPMLTGETLQRMVEVHRERRNLVTVLTAEVEDPTGYGRILRGGEAVVGIVEHKDADEAQRAVREINSGIYVFDAEALREGVSKLSNDNVQGEYYLTDVVTMAADGTVEVPGRGRVGAFRIDDVWQTEGVNDRVQLARMNAEVNRRIVTGWMRAGVTIIDPTSTWIQPDVDLANDVTLYPGVFLNGATTIGAGATVGPDVTVTDSEIREEATVTRSEVTLAVVGEGVRVGPFSNIRPGSVLDRDAKVGAFVETKNTHIGTEAAIPHMAYVGDSEVTAGSSIVAGSVLSRECAAPATVSDITSDSQDDTLNPEADQ